MGENSNEELKEVTEEKTETAEKDEINESEEAAEEKTKTPEDEGTADEESVENETGEETEEKSETEEKTKKVHNTYGADEATINEFIQTQLKAMKTSFTIWIIVLIYLVIVGLPACIAVYGVGMLIMFVVNLMCFLKMRKFAKSMENGEVGIKEIYEYFQTVQGRDVVLMILNFFLGGGLSIVGSIYELHYIGKALGIGEEILGEEYKKERVENDPNAKWKYCMYCKRNSRERKICRLSDGVMCSECLKKYSPMLPQRPVKAIEVKAKSKTKQLYFYDAATKFNLSSQELEDRLEYLKENNEKYSYFSPTKTLCDGCMEFDEKNSLFRIVKSPDESFDSTNKGIPTGLIHPYSAVQGVCYEMIYEWRDDYSSDSTGGYYSYTNTNTIVVAIEDKYITEEMFVLKQIPTKFLENSKKPQIDYAENTLNELHEIFDKPILPVRKIQNR